MPRVTFNQTVKHGTNIYNEGDAVTVTDEEAEYFGSHGWLEGIPAEKDAVSLDIQPTASIDIVPENPYINDTMLEVQNGTIGLGDTNG